MLKRWNLSLSSCDWISPLVVDSFVNGSDSSCFSRIKFFLESFLDELWPVDLWCDRCTFTFNHFERHRILEQRSINEQSDETTKRDAFRAAVNCSIRLWYTLVNAWSTDLIVLSKRVLSEQVNLQNDRIYLTNNADVTAVPNRDIVIQPQIRVTSSIRRGVSIDKQSFCLVCVSDLVKSLLFYFAVREREDISVFVCCLWRNPFCVSSNRNDHADTGDIRDQTRKKQRTNQGLAESIDARLLIWLVESDLVGPIVAELDSVFAVTFDWTAFQIHKGRLAFPLNDDPFQTMCQIEHGNGCQASFRTLHVGRKDDRTAERNPLLPPDVRVGMVSARDSTEHSSLVWPFGLCYDLPSDAFHLDEEN